MKTKIVASNANTNASGNQRSDQSVMRDPHRVKGKAAFKFLLSLFADCISVFLYGCFQDEIYDGSRILWRQEMTFVFLNDDFDLTSQLFITFFDFQCIVVEPRVEAAADVENRHLGFGQRSQIVQR